MIYLGIYLGIGLLISLVAMTLAHVFYIREIVWLGAKDKIGIVVMASFVWPICLFASIWALITKEVKIP